MPPRINVKICGLSTSADIACASDAGARYLGFVFFAKSPRNVSVSQAAELALKVAPGLAKVALTVNADNHFLDEITGQVPLDMLQLHGAETPERVLEIRARYGLPVMKAVGIADAADLQRATAFGEVSDQLLLDAKPPKNADLPGGNGLPFDWRLIKGQKWACPWMLAGGLTPDNVAEAIALTGAMQVDVSSGVESAPGIKDAGLIRTFIENARSGRA